MELLVLFGVLFALLVIGVPVAFSLLAAALACFLAMDIPPIVAVQRVAAGISVFTLMAIPFFIFAGELMMQGGIAGRLVRLAASAVGKSRGGLGVVNVASSMLFGGISGSAVADISALGSLLIPVMNQVCWAMSTLIPQMADLCALMSTVLVKQVVHEKILATTHLELSAAKYQMHSRRSGCSNTPLRILAGWAERINLRAGSHHGGVRWVVFESHRNVPRSWLKHSDIEGWV